MVLYYIVQFIASGQRGSVTQADIIPLKASRGDRRREAILEAATQVFVEHGFESATLDDIIKRSGGSRSTIYSQFGDKEGLFAAIVGTLCERIIASLSDALAADREPKTVLYRFASEYMSLLMAPDSVALYRMVIAESRRFPELGTQVFKSGPEATALRLRDYLRSETRRGRLGVRQPDRAARIFLEMVKGDLHTRALFGVGKPATDAEIDVCVREAVMIFLDGLRAA